MFRSKFLLCHTMYVAVFPHTIVSYHNIICSTHNEKKSCEMIACSRHLFLLLIFFLFWPFFFDLLYHHHQGLITRTFFFFFAGLSSKYWWGVWYRVFGRHQPSLDGIIWSLKYFWELPPSTPHLSQSHRSAQWGCSSHVSSQVWIPKWFWMMILKSVTYSTTIQYLFVDTS